MGVIYSLEGTEKVSMKFGIKMRNLNVLKV